MIEYKEPKDMTKTNPPDEPIDHERTDPSYWEQILESQGLGLGTVEETVDEERKQVWDTLEGSIQRERHMVFSVPRTQEELIHDINAAVEHLSIHCDIDITWKIHTSCSFGCDCIVLAAKGKKSLHINTHLIPTSDYDRGETLRYLHQVGTEDEGIYI
jgi:hypothetical protein